MEAMIAYSIGMLEAVARFLGSEPIIYLFGLICLAFLVKVGNHLLNIRFRFSTPPFSQAE